jgi:hypothetical protein
MSLEAGNAPIAIDVQRSIVLVLDVLSSGKPNRNRRSKIEDDPWTR